MAQTVKNPPAVQETLLGWLKISFGFFLMMLQKNPNELLGQCAGFQ